MPKPLPKPCKPHGIRPAIACLACRDLEIVDLLRRCRERIMDDAYEIDAEAMTPCLCREIDEALDYLS